MTEFEKTMKSDRIYEGKILNLRIDTVELPDKKYSKREIVEHPGGVAIVPITSNNTLLLIRQFRKAIDSLIYEIPAGKIEHNEEPRETAARELVEESGFKAAKLTYLSEFYTSPGYTNETIHLFLAEELIKESQRLDNEEYIEVYEVSFDEAMKMINRGEIMDAKTIIGIQTMLNSFNNK